MNSPTPKQYLNINNREVLSYTVDVFKQVKAIDEIVIVTDSLEHMEYVNKKYGLTSILGGPTRNISFYNALMYIKEHYSNCDKIIVNEAARPLITEGIVNDYLEILNDYDLVYSVKSVTDSLETSEGVFVDRSKYRLVMSPEGYRYEVIMKYFDKDSETTFPGHCIPLEHKRFGYTKYKNNIKLTYQEDLSLVSRLL